MKAKRVFEFKRGKNIVDTSKQLGLGIPQIGDVFTIDIDLDWNSGPKNQHWYNSNTLPATLRISDKFTIINKRHEYHSGMMGIEFSTEDDCVYWMSYEQFRKYFKYIE